MAHLVTRVKNLGPARFIRYLPPGGRQVETDEIVEIIGDLSTILLMTSTDTRPDSDLFEDEVQNNLVEVTTDFGDRKLSGVIDPEDDGDVATKSYVDSAVTSVPDQFIRHDGSVAFTDDQSMGSHKLTNVAAPASGGDATNKTYVDTAGALFTKKDGSVAFTGNQSMGTFKLTNVAAPASGGDATNKTYVDTADALFTKKDGSVAFTGDQSMDSHKLTNVTAPASGGDAANKTYVDTADALFTKKDGSVAFTGNQSMGAHKLTSLGTPTTGTDASTKQYVDDETTRATTAEGLKLAKASNLSDLGSASAARGNLGLGTSATLNVPAAGDAASGEVVKGSDTRLTNSRSPTAHASSHQAVGGDPVFGLAPIGSIIGWHQNFPGASTPALPADWLACNGQTVSDGASPYNGQPTPDLIGQTDAANHRFLRGSTNSNGIGGTEDHSHSISSASGSVSISISASTTQVQSGSGTEVVISVGASGSLTTFSAVTDVQPNLPTYFEVVWIIRIK